MFPLLSCLFRLFGLTPCFSLGVFLLLLIEQIVPEQSPAPSDEAVPYVPGYLFGGAGVVQNDLRKNVVHPITSTGITPGIIAVDVGIAEADNIHLAFPILRVILVFYRLLETAALSACPIRSFSPLPSVRSRSSGMPHVSKILFFFSSLLAWTLPAAWKAAPSTSTASKGDLSIRRNKRKST